MKGSKLKIFFFALAVIIVVADVTTGFVLDRLYRFNQYGMSGGTVNYYLGLNRPEVLIMGSSRAHQNLIPDSISPSCFNLSHNGMSVAFHTSLADVLAQQNALPSKYLVLQVEPADMVTEVQDLKKDIQYLKYYYRDNAFVKSEINEISRLEFLKYYFSSYRFNGTFFSLIKNAVNTKRNPPQNISGFEERAPTSNDSLLTMLSTESDRMKSLGKKVAFDTSKKNGLFYLAHIIELCREKNITLILFTSPYYGGSTRTDFTDSFTAWVAARQVTYLDYVHQDMSALNDPWLWKDHVHLNVNGAKIFTRIFAEDFEKIRSAAQ